jgi:hypothetical protein
VVTRAPFLTATLLLGVSPRYDGELTVLPDVGERRQRGVQRARRLQVAAATDVWSGLRALLAASAPSRCESAANTWNDAFASTGNMPGGGACPICARRPSVPAPATP